MNIFEKVKMECLMIIFLTFVFQPEFVRNYDYS